MAKYFAMRIIEGKLTYETVIAKYPELKEKIDEILKEQKGYEKNETNTIYAD